MRRTLWALLISFLPSSWREMAADTSALKGLRKDKSVENLIRTLLLHLGCGHSLRETVVRAKMANLADLSDVALLKRLKKSKEWSYPLCVTLFQEQGVDLASSSGFQVRAFDTTTVKEPGKTGDLWQFHYSVCLPSLPAHPRVHLMESQNIQNQFSFWPRYDVITGEKTGTSPFLGKNAIYITDDADRQGPPDNVRNAFEAFQITGIVDIVRPGELLRRLKVFTCYNYRGLPL